MTTTDRMYLEPLPELTVDGVLFYSTRILVGIEWSRVEVIEIQYSSGIPGLGAKAISDWLPARAYRF